MGKYVSNKPETSPVKESPLIVLPHLARRIEKFLSAN